MSDGTKSSLLILFLILPWGPLFAQESRLKAKDLYKKAEAQGQLTQANKRMPLFTLGEYQSPSWMEKDKYLEKAISQREIPVSVKIDKPNLERKTSKMEITGLGIINMPLSEVVLGLKEYNVLSKIQPYVKESIYDSKQHLLFLKCESYDYTAQFLFKTYESFDQSKKGLMQWLVLQGLFEGMKVNVELQSLGSRKTKIKLYSVYNYKNILIPEFFLEFGIKVVMQQAAYRLRDVLEKQFNHPEPSGDL